MIINTEAVGRIAVGVKTPIIKTGDNLTEIVIDSCLKTMGEFHDGAAIGGNRGSSSNCSRKLCNS